MFSSFFSTWESTTKLSPNLKSSHIYSKSYYPALLKKHSLELFIIYSHTPHDTALALISMKNFFFAQNLGASLSLPVGQWKVMLWASQRLGDRFNALQTYKRPLNALALAGNLKRWLEACGSVQA